MNNVAKNAHNRLQKQLNKLRAVEKGNIEELEKRGRNFVDTWTDFRALGGSSYFPDSSKLLDGARECFEGQILGEWARWAGGILMPPRQEGLGGMGRMAPNEGPLPVGTSNSLPQAGTSLTVNGGRSFAEIMLPRRKVSAPSDAHAQAGPVEVTKRPLPQRRQQAKVSGDPPLNKDLDCISETLASSPAASLPSITVFTEGSRGTDASATVPPSKKVKLSTKKSLITTHPATKEYPRFVIEGPVEKPPQRGKAIISPLPTKPCDRCTFRGRDCILVSNQARCRSCTAVHRRCIWNGKTRWANEKNKTYILDERSANGGNKNQEKDKVRAREVSLLSSIDSGPIDSLVKLAAPTSSARAALTAHAEYLTSQLLVEKTTISRSKANISVLERELRLVNSRLNDMDSGLGEGDEVCDDNLPVYHVELE